MQSGDWVYILWYLMSKTFPSIAATGFTALEGFVLQPSALQSPPQQAVQQCCFTSL